MKDLMLMLSDVMPEDMVISMIEEAIIEHKAVNTSDSRGKLAMICMLFASKDVASKTPGGVDELIRKSNEMEEARRFYPPAKN